MKIYKVKAPSGKLSNKVYNRKLASMLAKHYNAKYNTQGFKAVVFEEDAIVHDHPLMHPDTKAYVITHYEVRS